MSYYPNLQTGKLKVSFTSEQPHLTRKQRSRGSNLDGLLDCVHLQNVHLQKG